MYNNYPNHHPIYICRNIYIMLSSVKESLSIKLGKVEDEGHILNILFALIQSKITIFCAVSMSPLLTASISGVMYEFHVKTFELSKYCVIFVIDISS